MLRLTAVLADTGTDSGEGLLFTPMTAPCACWRGCRA